MRPDSAKHCNRPDVSEDRRAAVNVLGVKIDALNMSQALRLTMSALSNGQKGYICVTGVHGVMEGQKDPVFRRIVNSSFLTTPDGMPMVWLGRMAGHATMARVYGPDFMAAVCALSVTSGYRHYLYGGQDGVADELKHVLTSRFPGLQIVGTYTPPFRPLRPAEDAEVVQMISTAKPDIVWVGLSTPKQERFMAEHINRLDTKLMVGVGAAFDLHIGFIRDAPDWIKGAGLQWLHRLYQEPTRLWRRYLGNNPTFIAKVMLQILGITHYELVIPATLSSTVDPSQSA
jgi:N-acetylglucosaminyldiphosphoundecaprenol N-acetyl-beta-D-mannosaminyltransferase